MCAVHVCCEEPSLPELCAVSGSFDHQYCSSTASSHHSSGAQGGRIGVVGVYAGFCNHYNIGAFMEKGLTMAAGQVRQQKIRLTGIRRDLVCRSLTALYVFLSKCSWRPYQAHQTPSYGFLS